MTEGYRGDCFDKALEIYLKLAKKGAKMMIGETRSLAGDWIDFDNGRGMPLWHCWVENGNMVYDKSQGRSILWTRDKYYNRMRVENAMDYPVKKMDTKLVVPTPRTIKLAIDVLKKQYQLGRRDFTKDEYKIIES